MAFKTLVVGLAGVAAVAAVTRPASAVIRYGSADRNTTAPTGDLAGSGWQLQGQWGSFLGTPIGPNHFITAEHVGGNVGGTFQFNGASYTTVGFTDDPNTDLRIWQVSGTFPTFAPLYTAGNETTRPLVVFGRGTQRGEAVELATTPLSGEDRLRGWKWGADDFVQSWGTNVVSEIVPDDNPTDGAGPLLAFTFDDSAGGDEAALSRGDSGGAVFVRDPADNAWKLAGINLGVDGPWRHAPTDASFDASIFDAGNLYRGNPPVLVVDQFADLPAASYASWIGGSLPFIQSVVPEPGAASVIAVAAATALLRRRRRG